MGILANYYKTAVRNIARSKFHAVINIVGLSTGIAFSLLIAAYCWSEKQVNHQLRHADRQYFLRSHWKDPNMGQEITTLGGLAPALKTNYPALVANYYRWDGITSAVSRGDAHFRESIQLGDSTMLQVYGFPLLYGDARTALDNPFSVVITDDKAIKYFGRTDVVGRDLTIDNFSGSGRPFRITGVLKRPARNSITQFNDNNDNGIFVPTANLAYFGRNMDWSNGAIVSYIELKQGVKPEALAGPIKHLLQVNTPDNIRDNLRVEPVLLTKYYLDANEGTVRKMIYTLSFVALFILGMAIINFINLSVSRSYTRLKEIGVRKVLGGLRRQLRTQFLTESILLSLGSTAVALLIYGCTRGLFSEMLGTPIPALTTLPVMGWVLIVLFALFTGWLAGLYPATLLSSLSSIDALKSKPGAMQERVLLRKGLVGFQFGTATIVFIGAIIVTQQVALFFSNRLGYNKEYVLSAQLPRDWSKAGVQKMTAIRDVFARMPEVSDVTLTWNIPNGFSAGGTLIYPQGGDSSQAIITDQLIADEHFAPTFGIPLAAGVFFNAPDQSAAQDSTRVVLNEKATKALGWQRPQDAVGKLIHVQGSAEPFMVSGVVRDFHFNAMNGAVQPEVIVHQSIATVYRYFAFKIRPGNVKRSVDALQKKWAELMPGAPFEYQFMDQTLEHMYAVELRLRKATSTATVLAFVIVLLGILGLVSSSVRRRNKEIAIRKVIGASAGGIIHLFLRDYVPVLLLAGIVATPIAYWIMNVWLDDYATKVAITPLPFIGAIGVLAVIMIVLIAGQTLGAALRNPVNALRSD
ncbi:MAG TPA: ABC transporter permease [Puia sp.]|nr:ABC transporter permease [Puia sp.]